MGTQPIKTHWKKLHNPDYIGSWDFQPAEEKILTINKVATEKVPDQSGKKEDCSVCRFHEKVKPMVLNVTNSKAITKVAKSPYIEDWQGVKIQLYVTEVKAFGDIMEAVRVRPFEPRQAKPELKEGTNAYNRAIEVIASGEGWEKIESVYKVSAKAKQAIEESIKKTTDA